MTLPTTSELREMLDEATPGSWRADEAATCECCTHVRASATLVCTPDMADASLIALAPQLAEEVIRLREEIEDEIRSLRAPLCSHMPEGDELDRYLEEWEMQSYMADILTRIIDRPTRIKEGSSE